MKQKAYNIRYSFLFVVYDFLCFTTELKIKVDQLESSESEEKCKIPIEKSAVFEELKETTESLKIEKVNLLITIIEPLTFCKHFYG